MAKGNSGYGLLRRRVGPSIKDLISLPPDSRNATKKPPMHHHPPTTTSATSSPSHPPLPPSSHTTTTLPLTTRPCQTDNDSNYPQFQSRPEFDFEKNLSWYPPHMNRGSVEILKQLKGVDAVLEVRDCRAPLTSANYFLTDAISRVLFGEKRRLVLLNKADLVAYDAAQQSKNVIQAAGLPCLLTDANRSSNVVKIQQFVLQSCEPKFKTIGLWMMVVGLPNVGKSSIINALKRMAFASAKYSHPGSNSLRNVPPTKAPCSMLPGLTKRVAHFQISHSPRLYCLDTPGIMLPKQEGNPEIMMKLAALGCIDDHWVGEMLIGDYILYYLNKRRMFDYVDVLELPEPLDDIQLVCAHISQMLQRSNYLKIPQAQSGVNYFIQLFRRGHFGSVSFDELPSQHLVAEQLSEGGNLLEPPGPWGPRQYAEPTRGLH